jgi:hypothetical protein
MKRHKVLYRKRLSLEQCLDLCSATHMIRFRGTDLPMTMRPATRHYAFPRVWHLLARCAKHAVGLFHILSRVSDGICKKAITDWLICIPDTWFETYLVQFRTSRTCHIQGYSTSDALRIGVRGHRGKWAIIVWAVGDIKLCFGPQKRSNTNGLISYHRREEV